MDPEFLKQMPSDLFPGVIYVYDLENQGNYFMNDKFEELLGFSSAEIAEMGAGLIATLIHPEDKVRVESVMKDLGKVELGKTIKTEYRLKDKEGKWHWFADRSCVTKTDDNGNPLKIVGTALDITDSKDSAVFADELYNIFQLILDNLPLSVSWKDLDGKYLGFNKQFLKKVGLPEDSDIVGKTDNDLPWKDTNAQAYKEAEQRVMSDNQAQREVLEEHVTKDGHAVVMRASRIPVQDSDGDVVGIINTHEDVTDNVLLPKAVEALEKRYAMMLHTAADAVFVINGEDGRILEVNHLAENTSGYSRDELMGESFEKLHPEDKREEYSRLFAEAVREEVNIFEELLIERKGGEVIPFELKAFVFSFEGQKLIRCNYRDVTDTRSVEVGLRELCNSYRVILEELPQYVIQLSSECVILQANAAFRDFIKVAGDAQDDIDFIQFVDAGQRARFKDAISGLKSAGETLSIDLTLSNDSAKNEGDCSIRAVAINPEQPLEYQIVFKQKISVGDEDRLHEQLARLEALRDGDKKQYEMEAGLVREKYEIEARKLKDQITEYLAGKEEAEELLKNEREENASRSKAEKEAIESRLTSEKEELESLLDNERKEFKTRLQNESAELKAKLKAESDQSAKLKADILKLNTQLKEENASGTELNNRITEYKKSLNEKEQKIAGLREELQDSMLGEKQLRESERELNERIDALESAREEQEQMLVGLREERRLASQELKVREAELELDKYLKDVPIACIVIGADGKISEWNEEAVRTFGYSRDEALGNDIVRLIVPRKDRPKIKAYYEQLRDKSDSDPVIRQSYSKDKEVITCEWHHRLSPTDGSIVAFAYEVSAGSEKDSGASSVGGSFRNMFSNNDSIILLVDGDNLEVVELNRAAEKFYGYTRRSLLRKRLTEIDLNAEQHMAKLFVGQDELSSNFFRARHRLKNNEIRDVEFYSSIFEDREKKLIVLIGHDITERLELERKLKRSEELSRLALQATGAGVWDWDLQTDTVTFSRSWKEMLGYADDEIGYNSDEFYERVHPDELDAVKERIKKHLKDGEDFNLNIRLRCRDDSYKWVKYVGKSVKDNDDNIIRFVGTNIDISETRRLLDKIDEIKSEASRATLAKSHFIANMTREIRTPISAVVGFCELLRETVLNSVQEDYVRHINSSSEMLVRILDNMLDLVRVEVGTLEIKLENVEPEKFVSDIVESHADAAEAKGLYLDFDHEDNVPENIETDPERLKQILDNLINNAVRFTDTGSIHVNLGIEDGDEEGHVMLRVDVKDTGIGIPNKLHNEIFDAFSAHKASDGDQQEHYGFSLALSRSLAKLLGGNIGVESTVNKGSKFTLKINTNAVDSPAYGSGGAGSNPLRKPKAPRPLRVLYVEDIELNQHVAEAIMEKLNHDLDMVSSAKEALELLEKKDFDVILMDIHMPEMDGLQCSRVIRKQLPPEKQPYIIAVTAAVITNDRKSCLAAGMDDYLTKPLKKDTLKEALKQAYQKVVLDVK